MNKNQQQQTLIKYVKLPSQQGGSFFSPTAKNIDFTIPEGTYNMSKSAVHLICSMDETNIYGATSFVDVLHNVGLSWSQDEEDPDPDINLDNTDLIRNVSLSCSKQGMLENIRRVNVLRKNLKSIVNTDEELTSEIYTLKQTRTYDSANLWSPFREFVKVGTTRSSVKNNTSLRIPLKNLMLGLGSETTLNTQNLGELRLHLELENLKQFVPVINTTNITGYQAYAQDFLEGNTIEMVKKYDRLEDSPYFVGQLLMLDKYPETIVEGEDAEEPVQVTGIQYDELDGTIHLTFSRDTVAQGQAGFPPIDPDDDTKLYVGVTIREIPIFTASNVNFTIKYAELEMAVSNQTDNSNQLQFMTYTTEEHSGAVNLPHITHQFSLEPSCVNVFVMFPQEHTLLSVNNSIDYYRLRLENQDVSANRDIFLNISQNYYGGENDFNHQPLYYDNLTKLLVNAGFSVKNLSHCNMSNTNMILNTRFPLGTENSITILGVPTPDLDNLTNQKLFQLNVYTKGMAVIGQVVLYKQVIKSIKL